MKKEHSPDSGHSFEDYFKRAISPMLVLHLLSQQPMYVYQMQQELSRRSQGRYTLSLLYPVLYRLVKECEPNQRLFDFVWGSVAALDALDEGVANFHLWFLTNLSRFLGFSPGNAYLPGAWFDIREGSFTPLRPPHGEVLSADDARILHDLLECDVRYIAEIGLNRRQRVAYLDALLVYYGYHLDAIHAVQSVRILQEVF